MLTTVALDAIGWDSANWGRFFEFSSHYGVFRDKRVLELGCGCDNGGLSLWVAVEGAAEIVCSDYTDPRTITQHLHRKYRVENLIRYASVNALQIPYNCEFDIVCFKSMLGGIVRDSDNEVVGEIFRQMAKALKRDGVLLFAENC